MSKGKNVQIFFHRGVCLMHPNLPLQQHLINPWLLERSTEHLTCRNISMKIICSTIVIMMISQWMLVVLPSLYLLAMNVRIRVSNRSQTSFVDSTLQHMQCTATEYTLGYMCSTLWTLQLSVELA